MFVFFFTFLWLNEDLIVATTQFGFVGTIDPLWQNFILSGSSAAKYSVWQCVDEFTQLKPTEVDAASHVLGIRTWIDIYLCESSCV